MTVYQLIDEAIFPPVSLADPNGLIAVGGDLSPERLLLAYSSGIFPWFNENDPILWWSPDPRFILFPDKLIVSKKLEKRIRSGKYRVTTDQAFEEVMQGCAEPRKKGGDGTWITTEMLKAFLGLFKMGYAHSIECWDKDDLVGGLYGVSLGRCFFGESMFYKESDASKVAFVMLVRALQTAGFEVIDCQMQSEHLESLGAESIPRVDFLKRLQKGGVRPSTVQTRGKFPLLLF